jgi:hypothetical protein
VSVLRPAKGEGRGRDGLLNLVPSPGLAWLRWATVAGPWPAGPSERLTIRCLEILEVS